MMLKNKVESVLPMVLSICLLIGAVGGVLAAGPVAPVGLLCDWQRDPVAVEDVTPPFSWRFLDDRPGAAQTMYQIQVSSGAGFEGELMWDSGKVESSKSQMVAYGGAAPVSRGEYRWRVRYRDQDGKESPWSEPATFGMGILNPAEWEAQWIQPQEWEPNGSPHFFKWCEMATLPAESAPQLGKGMESEWKRLIASRAEALKRTPYFRKTVKVSKPVKRACLRYSARGFCEPRINGRKVTGNVMDPAVSQYSQSVNYVTLDVTDRLVAGENVLGFVLGDGWLREEICWGEPSLRGEYGTPALRAQLEIEYSDGQKETVGSDATWRQGVGGLLANSHFLGEFFDGALEPDGWDRAGFEDAEWKPSKVVRPPGNPKIVSQSVFPQREVERLQPVKISEPREGVWVFAFAKTFTGYIELNLPAVQKATVYVRPSEWVWKDGMPGGEVYGIRYPDGQVRRPTPGMIVCKGRSSCVLSEAKGIPRGPTGLMTWGVKPVPGEVTVWKPRFSLQVMRYVEVTGLDFRPTAETVTGISIRNDIPLTGEFRASNPVLEKVFRAAVSSSLQNSQSMSWDNATERNQTTWPWTWAVPLNLAIGDFSLLYRKFLADQEVWFLPDGKSSGQTLSMRAYGYRGVKTPIHETPVIDLPWILLAYYGDADRVREYFPNIRRYVDYYWAGAAGQNYLSAIKDWKSDRYGEPFQVDPNAPATNSGDHLQGRACMNMPSSPVSGELYVTLGHWLDVLRKAAWMSGKLGIPDEQTYYEGLAAKITDAIRESGMRDPEAGTYGARRIEGKPATFDTRMGNPVSNAIAVAEGIAKPEDARQLADITFHDMQANYGGHFVGGREWYRGLYLLSELGYMDKASEWMQSTEHPAVGFFIEKVGLDTIPEGRDIMPGWFCRESIAQAEWHCFANWFVELLCGIRRDPDCAGMQSFLIAPIIPNNLESASLSMESPYGKIHSGWRRTGDSCEMRVGIPPNTTCTVRVPTLADLRINGKAPGEVAGIRPIGRDKDGQTLRFPAGQYGIRWGATR